MFRYEHLFIPEFSFCGRRWKAFLPPPTPHLHATNNPYLKVIKNLVGIRDSKILVIVVVNLDHRSVDTGTKALNLKIFFLCVKIIGG